MNKSIKVNVHSFLYVLGIFSYVTCSILESSTLAIRYNGVTYIYTMLKGIVFACTIFKILLLSTNKIKKSIIYILIMVVVCGLIYLMTGSYRIPYFILFLVLAYNVEDKIIVKSTLNSLIMSVSLVVILAITGVIENYTYARAVLSEDSVAYAMGFDYYSYLPMYILFGCVMASYLKENLKIHNYLFMLLLMFAAYFCCRKRLTLIIGVFFLVGHIIFVKRKYLDLTAKWIKNFCTILPEIMFLFTVFLTLKYGNGNSSVDLFFNGRLKYGKLAFMRYPLNLFGNKILMYGGSSSKHLASYEYFYIDSGYIYSVLGYGMVFTILLLIGLSFLMRYSCENEHRELWWWLIIVLIYNVLGDVFLTITYNPILIVMISIIVKQKGYGRGRRYD